MFIQTVSICWYLIFAISVFILFFFLDRVLCVYTIYANRRRTKELKINKIKGKSLFANVISFIELFFFITRRDHGFLFSIEFVLCLKRKEEGFVSKARNWLINQIEMRKSRSLGRKRIFEELLQFPDWIRQILLKYQINWTI